MLTCSFGGRGSDVEAWLVRSLSTASVLELAEMEEDSEIEFLDSISASAEGIFSEFFEGVLETPSGVSLAIPVVRRRPVGELPSKNGVFVKN